MPRVLRKRPIVLIVDSDDRIQRSVTDALYKAGLDCRSLVDGSMAHEIAAEEQPDFVLLETDVGGVDGRDILRSLKRDPRTAHIPVFMTSEREKHWGRLLAFKLGADEYLDKPLMLGRLARRIVFHLEKLGRLPVPPPTRTGDAGLDRADIDRQQAEGLLVEELKRARKGVVRRAPVAVQGRPVLIVEDDETIRESLAHILEDEGIDTLTASNGQEALDVLHREQTIPAAILLDLKMPVMDGWEFRRRLEGDDSIGHPPVIVMSVHPPDHTMVSAAWLQKPLAISQLLSTIARVASH
jgi:DNA-binding response OmpR family regulator